MNRLTIRGMALAVGLFFDITFLLCVVWGLLVPTRFETMAPLWEALFPGFTWLTPASVLLGLLEAFLYGVYVAAIFVPLFNSFEGRRSSTARQPSDATVPREAVAHR